MKTIMLACSAGMSTSLLVSKMQEAAKNEGIEAEIFACASNEVEKMLEDRQDIDVLLLGPQVRFMLSSFEKKVDGRIPVAVIDMADYGMMNGENVLHTALKLIEG